jgi:hypothetical protein
VRAALSALEPSQRPWHHKCGRVFCGTFPIYREDPRDPRRGAKTP